MRKMINDPARFAEETVEGIVAAYGDKLRLVNGDRQMLVTNYPVQPGKVGIVTGGGSGHLPVFLGYVGQGMLDGCAIGNVFASPSAQKMYGVISACNYGGGVLCLYGNYGGDNLNFDMACEMAGIDDVPTRTVRVHDDVASSPAATREKRRGVAGMVYAFKAAGAAAEKMKGLDEVAGIAARALENIRSIGVALSPCVVPHVGKPTFSIADDEIEIGMGIHGEPGIEVRKLMPADEMTDILMDRLLEDLPLSSGDEVSVMVNGLGATPLEEQLIVFRALHRRLTRMGVGIVMPHIGEFATSMEMAGLSVSLFRLDAEMKELLLAPARTPFYTNLNK